MTDRQPLRLGALIALLEQRPADNSVSFDFCGLMPAGVRSYRGYYDHLAIGHTADCPAHPTVATLIRELRGAVGQIFEGYKGGSFRMDENTPVWVSNYGESHSTAVVGVRALGYTDAGYWTIIETAHCENWSGSFERAHAVLFNGLGFGNVKAGSE